jgi:putative nucleotidyltransferase with HDIG domain
MKDLESSLERYPKRIQAYIARMPSLSTTVIKVLETCNDPKSSANDLKRVISLDPVLTGRVLRLINSAYYSIGRPISSLTRAIIMLGINTVKNLALSFAILDNLKGKSSVRSFSMDEFWTHSLCVGIIAKSLATLKSVPPGDREEFFVAGLLHDLGKLPLQKQFSDEYDQVWEDARREQNTLFRSEINFFGFDHCEVGCMIAEKWRLGLSLVESLSHHHHPDQSSETTREFVSIVSLSNQLANDLNIGNAGDHFIDHAMISALIAGMGFDRAALTDLHAMVLNEIDKAKVFLEVLQDE